MPSRPNILLITSDQHRGDSLGCYGHPCVRTPHIDMLSAEAIRFTQAYTDCPICIPARTTMISGIQSHHYGCPSYKSDFHIQRDPGMLIGNLLVAAGYQTCLVGKTHWHLSNDMLAGFQKIISFDSLKAERQERLGRGTLLTGIGMNEMTPMLSYFPPELCTTDWAVNRSIDFLASHDRSRPFFLWTSFINPHPPNQIHEPYYSMHDNDEIPMPVRGDWDGDETCPFAVRIIRIGNGHAHMKPAEIRKARSVYYGMITNIDHQIGRLFGTLMRLGLWEDTLVIFTSDHGEHLGDYGTYFKGTFLEGAARIPMLIRPPKDWPADRGAEAGGLVELADLLPTICDVAQSPKPPDIDGRSLAPLLRNSKAGFRDYLHGQIGNQHMLHDGRYKYLYFADDGRELLFDKSSDSLDQRDLSGDERLVAPLRLRLMAHLAEEKHPHLEKDKLLNMHRTVTEQDLSNVIGWMGLGGAN